MDGGYLNRHHEQVWDGEKWVEHEGVVFRGEKEVINYEGLTATPDHLVFTEDLPYPVEFEYSIKEGLKLWRKDEWHGEKFPYKGRKKCTTSRTLDQIIVIWFQGCWFIIAVMVGESVR